MPTENPPPGEQPVHGSSQIPFAELVGWLRDNLGIRLVIYVAGWATSSTVTSWVEGKSTPAYPVQTRLRESFEIAALLRERFDGAAVEAWFTSGNPQLGDRSPAQVLREAGGARVVRAVAESFAAGS